jgi:ketosteroid isomerase-like protein
VQVNRPDVLAEVEKAFAEYETALANGDNERLVEFFWDAPQLVRYGLADQQDGFAELRAWRLAQPPVPAGRELSGTSIVTFGADFAVTTTCFEYPSNDGRGRQSQTWVRTADGWRIVSAHVSWLDS